MSDAEKAEACRLAWIEALLDLPVTAIVPEAAQALIEVMEVVEQTQAEVPIAEAYKSLITHMKAPEYEAFLVREKRRAEQNGDGGAR